ncbi:GXWXG domain-containing protein [Trichoderma camerunense]
MSRPEEEFIRLTKVEGLVSETEAEQVFNQLKPIAPSFLIGKWKGGDLNTGHIGHQALSEMRWAGKDFRSENDGDPIMVLDEQGNRIWNKDWGHCSVSYTCLTLTFRLLLLLFCY